MINYYLPSSKAPKQRSSVTVDHAGKQYALRVEHFSEARIDVPWPNEHTHDTYHVLIFRNDTRMGLNGTVHDVRANDIVLVGAGVPHRFMTAADDSASEYFEMTFELTDGKMPLVMPFTELLSIMFPGFDVPASILHLPTAAAEECRAVIGRLPPYASRTMKSNFFGLAVSAGLIELLAHILVSYDAGTAKHAQRTDRAVRFIYLNYHRRFTLEEAAEYCHCNPQYLSRLFHREMKKTVMEYANEVRITIAERMLKSREYRIREVARMTGFEDEFYFSKVFKQITGMTPGTVQKGK